MSTTSTTNISLVKDNADEPVKNFRTHVNSNMDAIDAQIKALVDVVDNAKALLGQLGVDQNGDPLVDAATARANLDAARDNGSGTTLYAAQQAIADNAADISALQDSVSSDMFMKYRYLDVTSLDDIPANTFGRIVLPADVGPTSVTSYIYLCMRNNFSTDRALMLFRAGTTQAWLNTRNSNGWHGWKELV